MRDESAENVPTGGKVQLTKYFEAVDRRLERKGLMPVHGFRVKVCGRLIDVRFPTQEVADVGRLSVSGFVVDDPEELARPADATFLYWYDTCEAYLPEGEAEHSSVWRSQDATGSLSVGTDSNQIVGCDIARQRYYFARPEPTKDPQLTCRHTLVNAFARWARANGILLLHAACVGVDGEGVLVVGTGGRGKSTFAVSCLAAGMDFVSDDYTLLTASGPLVGMPLYSCIGVREDMRGKIPGLGEPNAYILGKPMFEVPAERFADGIGIKAIIHPVVAGDEHPSIRPVDGGNAMAQLIHSTINQLESRGDRSLVVIMAQRLSGLPVFEMSMGSNLEENPAFLREFLEKGEYDVQAQ